MAAIIGAFLAGMVVAETTEHWDVERCFHSISTFMTPFFFVVMGSRVDPRLFLNAHTAGLMVALTLLAILGKILVCGGAALPLGKRRAVFVGAAMVPRGEVSVIVVSMGQALGVVSPATYSTVLGLTILTTIVTPPLLKALAPLEKGD